MHIPQNRYKVDFEKVKTIEDIKSVLQAMEILIGTANPFYGEVKNLLKKEKEEFGLATMD